MNNFEILKTVTDLHPFVAELDVAESLWQKSLQRQSTIAVHRETQAIFLRAAERRDPAVPLQDVQFSRWTAASALFPIAISFMEDFAKEQDAELQRALMVRLRPHKDVGRHVDSGSYYARRDRFHFVIHSKNGSLMTCGLETATLREGELWWFNNKLQHSGSNLSDQWRVHLIFDLLPIELRRPESRRI